MDKWKLSYLLVNHRWVNSKGLKRGPMLHHWISERKFAVLTLTFNLLHLHSKNSKCS